MKPCVIRKPTETKKGVNKLFQENPELAKVGSPEQYSQYLDTIFPNSKVKDIVYRGSEFGIDSKKHNWLYFTDSKDDAYMYAKAHVSKGGKITERNPIPTISKNLIKKYNLNKTIFNATIDTQLGIDGLEYYGHISKKQADKARQLLNTNQDVKDLNRLIELYDIVKIESEADLMKQYDDTDYLENIDEYNSLRKKLDKFFDREDIGKIETALVNIKNPYMDEINQEDLRNNRDSYKEGHDGAFLMGGEHFLIKNNSEQIHILGSKKDIQGFEDYAKNNPVKETIEVTASNGKPSIAFEKLKDKFGDVELALRAYVNMYTSEFQQWFKGSKVVDTNGEPKVLYLDLNNEDGNVFILGENLVSNIPMYVSSKNPTINEDGNYIVEDVNQIQDVFNKSQKEDLSFDLSPIQQGTATTTTFAISEVDMLTQQKEQLYYNVKERLSKINNRLQIIERGFNVKKTKAEKQTEKAQYKKLLRFKLKSEEILKQYSEDIRDLKNSREEEVIRELLDNDLARMNELMKKANLTTSEYTEAKRIVNFFQSLNPQKKIQHPFFKDDQLFDEQGESILDEKLLEYFQNLSKQALAFNNKLVTQRNKLALAIVNANPRVKNLYGDKGLSEKEILKNLKDAHWFDKWLMDASMGVFTDNGILPQVALTEIILSVEKRQIESEKINRKIDKLQPEVEKELRKLGQSLNFMLIPGVSWGMFKQKDQYGLETGKIVTRYSTRYSEIRTNTEDLFDLNINKAFGEKDPNRRNNLINKAADKRQNWYRKNTIQIDVRKLPAILNDPAFAEFADFFEEEGAQEHENNLKANLSEKAYDEVIAEQKKKLFTFLEKRKILSEQGVMTTQEFLNWDRINNPFIANAYFYDNIKINHEIDSPSMEYNVNVPRKNKVIVTAKNNILTFKETNDSLNYYDDNFKQIEENKTLYEFHKEILKVLKNIKNNLAPHLQSKVDLNTVMSIDKTLTEAVLESDSKWDSLSTIASRSWRGFVNSISGKLVESLDSNINQDKINDNFIKDNIKEVTRLENLSKLLLEQALGIKITKFTKIYKNSPKLTKERNTINNRIKKNKENYKKETDSNKKKIILKNLKTDEARLKRIMTFDDLNLEAIKVLSDLLGVNETIDDIKNKLNNETVILKPLLKKASANEIARQKSFDLPRIMKLYSTLAGKHQARTENKVIQDILKEAYENITVPKGSEKVQQLDSSGKKIIKDLRTNANEAYNSWYKRTILDQNIQHLKQVQQTLKISEVENIKDFLGVLKGFSNGTLKQVLNKQEKKIVKKIDTLLEKNKKENFLTPEQVSQLEKEKREVGRRIGIQSLFSGLLTLSRLRALGYGLKSSLTNRMEGIISNNILSALGLMSNKSYLRAVGIARKSFWKNLYLSKDEEAIKVSTIMNKLQKIQDSANELQRSSVKSSYSKLGVYLNPFELNKRVEFLNQSTIITARLLDTIIYDKDGKKSNVFDALNPDGTLKTQFKTIENINNWELFRGEQYKNWTLETESLINLAHGNYSELRGMMAKDTQLGLAAMMFKTWWPMGIATRFATEQDNIIIGKKGFKGRYRSYSTPALAINAALLGFVSAGFVSTGVGAAFGSAGIYSVTAVAWKKFFERGEKMVDGKAVMNSSVLTDMGALSESLYVIRTLAAKAIGLPVNRIAGKEILGDWWMGNYLDKVGANFTKEDALNMNANMVEAALLTQRLMLMTIMSMAMMSMLGGDEEKLRPGWYNFIINQLQNLNSNINSMLPTLDAIQMFTDPEKVPAVDTGLEVFNAGGQLLNKFGGLALGFAADPIFDTDFKQGLFHYDNVQAGKNRGQSYFWNSVTSLFPGSTKDAIKLLQGDSPNYFKETYIGNPMDMVFEKSWKKARRRAINERIIKKNELLEEGYSEEVAQKIVEKTIPLPSEPKKDKLNKKIMELNKGR